MEKFPQKMDVIQIIKIQSEAKNLHYHFDPEKISLCLSNLLNNAVKFSPKKSEIHFNIFNSDDGDLHIQIADMGPGIPEAEKEVVFEDYRKSQLTDDGSGGVGLGLGVCKKIIELHWGHIWIEDKKNIHPFV